MKKESHIKFREKFEKETRCWVDIYERKTVSGENLESEYRECKEKREVARSEMNDALWDLDVFIRQRTFYHRAGFVKGRNCSWDIK